MKHLIKLIGYATLVLMTFLSECHGKPFLVISSGTHIDAYLYGLLGCNSDPYKITEGGSLVHQLRNVNKEFKLSKVAQHVGVTYVSFTTESPFDCI
jgi:hypothetical protein